MIDPGALMVDLLGMVEKLLGETIRVDVSRDHALWHCEVDPNQLESAVVNLAVNARDAMPNGGTLSVRLENRSVDTLGGASLGVEPSEYVFLAIKDEGVGMDAHTLEHAFDPFFTTKAPGHGTGLGLSMAHGFVSQSSGHLRLISSPGQGTTAEIYLPRALE